MNQLMDIMGKAIVEKIKKENYKMKKFIFLIGTIFFILQNIILYCFTDIY